MEKRNRLTQEDLGAIRSELSKELGSMNPAQREEYLSAAKDVYKGLLRMVKIRELVKA